MKIKVLSLLAALAFGGATTNLPAPPSGGATCSQVTSGWACTVTLPAPTIWQFNLSVGSAYSYSKVYLNGSLYGTTSATTFGWPTYLHGSIRVEAYSNMGGCIRDLGTFSL